MKRILLHNWTILLIVCIGAFIRFYNPLWDNGLFLHPDERLFVNASNLSLPTTIHQFFSINSPLNPHMFYYGSVLLYLYKLASLISPYSFLMTSRLISAFFSSLTIAIIFLIGKELFSKKVGILSSIVFAFAVGSIQYAHFDTTESYLIFLLSLVTYIDILSVKKQRPMLFMLSLTLVGIAGSVKITGLTFGISSFLSLLLLLRFKKNWKKTIIAFISGSILTLLIYCILSPYQFIDASEYATQQSYMQAVTYGAFKPPFVIIYQNTIPYLYQLTNVFPFVFGFIAFPVALIGIFLLLKQVIIKKESWLIFFLLVFPCMYFMWSGDWFAKYARYYLLLLPFLSLWAGYALSRIRSKIILCIVLLLCISNGLLFTRIYLKNNTRVSASQWIYVTIPKGSIIATESWDDALPLSFPGKQAGQYTMLSIPSYDTDSTQKIAKLAGILSKSNYVILSSRRVYVSIEDNPQEYPLTHIFYKKLFSGALGFKKVYSVTNYPFFISDDFADETFQSYDHPPVIIFTNLKHFSLTRLTKEMNR